MACSDINGRWLQSILVDTAEDVTVDPKLEISNPTGSKFVGKFMAAGETEFEVECNNGGPKSKIRFVRIHPDGTTTEYKGTVVSFGDRAVVGIIKGTFDRKPARDSKKLATNGDWETEKPT